MWFCFEMDQCPGSQPHREEQWQVCGHMASISHIHIIIYDKKNMVQMSLTMKINFTHLDIENPLGTLDLFSNFLIRPSSTSAF